MSTIPLLEGGIQRKVDPGAQGTISLAKVGSSRLIENLDIKTKVANDQVSHPTLTSVSIYKHIHMHKYTYLHDHVNDTHIHTQFLSIPTQCCTGLSYL